MKALFNIRLGPGTSRRLIAYTLRHTTPNNRTSRINFLVTNEFEIYLDHHANHEILEKRNELQHEDIACSGNLGIIHAESRIAISHKAGGSWYPAKWKPRTESEERLALLEKVDFTILEYLNALLQAKFTL